jgi:hypothetical protein
VVDSNDISCQDNLLSPKSVTSLLTQYTGDSVTFRFRTLILPALGVFTLSALVATAQLSTCPQQRVTAKVDRKIVSVLAGTYPFAAVNATICTRLIQSHPSIEIPRLSQLKAPASPLIFT